MGGHEEDGRSVPLLADEANQIYPVHFRHHHVHQNQVHPAPHHGQYFDRLHRAARLEDAVARLGEQPKGEPSHDAGVVHHEDRANETDVRRRRVWVHHGLAREMDS